MPASWPDGETMLWYRPSVARVIAYDPVAGTPMAGYLAGLSAP
jgi:hypothetical protein